jgi:endonuclease/exonuclease/phosphatase (EEP) superfamily protein YafD
VTAGTRTAPLRAAAVWVAAGFLVGVAVLIVAIFVVGPRAGPFALLAILLEQIVLATIAVGGLAALVLRSRRAGIAWLVLLGVCAVRLGSTWVSVPATGTPDLVVTTWNVEIASRPAADNVALLRTVDGDVVGIEELDAATAAAIAADPVLSARFPYRLVSPRGDVLGIGLLSRFPLRDEATSDPANWIADPPRVEALVATPAGDVRVMVAHPLPGDVQAIARVPVSFDPTKRDPALIAIRARADAAIARGERLILLGDFNTTPTEAVFGDLTRGLRDAQVEAGEGPGWTWRPHSAEFLGAGLLRIDLVLSSDGARPLGTSIACPPVGDHCRLSVPFALQ